MKAPEFSGDDPKGDGPQEMSVTHAEAADGRAASVADSERRRALGARSLPIPSARQKRGPAIPGAPSRDANDGGNVAIPSNEEASRYVATRGADAGGGPVVAKNARAPGGDSKRKRPARSRRAESVADLIGGWYGNPKNKALKPPTKPQMRAMANAWRLDQTQERSLIELAAADKTLDKTRQLLHLVVGMQEGEIAGALQNFTTQVLRNHPIFCTPSFAEAFAHTRGAPGATDRLEEVKVTRLIHLVMSNDLRPVFPPEKFGRKRQGEMERCRRNAVYCTLMWLYLTGRIRLGPAVDCLREHIWKPAAAQHGSESDMLRAVMGAGGIASASVASGLLEERLRDQAARELAAGAAEGRAGERARDADAKVAEAEVALAEVRRSSRALRAELEKERRLRADEGAAWRDERQRLVGTFLRRLRAEVSMLEDGLRALKRIPPKVGVMVDHGERVLEGLRGEIERLGR